MGNYLGIDPSTKATGYGIINDKGELLDYGVLSPDPDMDFGQMLVYKQDFLRQLVREYKIMAIGCEDQYSGVNPDTFKKLSRVTGLVQMLAAQQELPLELYYPAAWRKVFHNTGKAKKRDTLNLVNQKYGIKLLVKQNDISDAIGIAYTTMTQFTTNK
jgi:crossover junction endodeoxyribonuclease RuvC